MNTNETRTNFLIGEEALVDRIESALNTGAKGMLVTKFNTPSSSQYFVGDNDIASFCDLGFYRFSFRWRRFVPKQLTQIYSVLLMIFRQNFVQIFERTLRKIIESKDTRLWRKMLAWVAVTRRPMSLSRIERIKLRYAIARNSANLAVW